MIFVTVGTNETRFDRLLSAVDALQLAEEVVVQRGPSSVALREACVVDFLPFEVLVQEVRRARVVVTHAGVGSVIVALSNNRRPIVMPRLARHGEAVDDHQLAFAQRFERAGLVTIVETAGELADAVGSSESGHVGVDLNGVLAAELRGYLEQCISGIPPDDSTGRPRRFRCR